jgi:hypothetical protein
MWHVWERRLNAYRIPIRKPEGKRPLGRTRRRWEDNIKMGIIFWYIIPTRCTSHGVYFI